MGRIEDLERRTALLERDLEGLETIVTSLKDDIKYLIRKVKETYGV